MADHPAPPRMRWQDCHSLAHYTKSADIVRSILLNGFMLVPNRRNLANRLLGTEELFRTREPQQFGMVSFTELPRDRSLRHREEFGEFGIVVRWEWAVQHDAQRVLYVGSEGSVLNSLSWIFRRARQELEKGVPEAAEAYLANKVIAGMYSQLYSHLLTLYEFMEPDTNSSQVEWRIVSKTPYHHRNINNREAMMVELLELASHGIGTLKVRPVDVEALLCPEERLQEMRRVVPTPFSEVPILPLTRPSRLSSLWYLFLSCARMCTRRTPRVILQAPPTTGAPVIVKSSAGMFTLPPMKEIGGILVHPDEVLERADCEIQYESKGGETLELRMPFTQAIRLLSYLADMARDPKMRELVLLATKHEEALMARAKEEAGRTASAAKPKAEHGPSSTAPG